MEKIFAILKTIFWRFYFLSKSSSAFKERNFLAKAAILLYLPFALFVTLAIVIAITRDPPTPEEKAESARQSEERRVLAEQADAEKKRKLEEEQQNAEIAAAEEKRKALAQLPLVTANEFAKKYSDNQVAANLEFKDKRFRISGVIHKIDDDNGHPRLSLFRNPNTGDDYDFAAPAITFKTEYYEAISKLKKRQKITAVCTGIDPSLGDHARANDCDLI